MKTFISRLLIATALLYMNCTYALTINDVFHPAGGNITAGPVAANMRITISGSSSSQIQFTQIALYGNNGCGGAKLNTININSGSYPFSTNATVILDGTSLFQLSGTQAPSVRCIRIFYCSLSSGSGLCSYTGGSACAQFREICSGGSCTTITGQLNVIYRASSGQCSPF